MNWIIHVPEKIKIAVESIDTNELDKTVDQCIEQKQWYPLQKFPLEKCTSLVFENFEFFKRYLIEFSKAKRDPKLRQNRYLANKYGRLITFYIKELKKYIDQEKKDRETFDIFEENLYCPSYFSSSSKSISVKIDYKWFRKSDSKWISDSIEFIRNVYPVCLRFEQRKWESQWEDIRCLALSSLQDYFRQKTDENDIPKKHEILGNNAKFW